MTKTRAEELRNEAAVIERMAGADVPEKERPKDRHAELELKRAAHLRKEADRLDMEAAIAAQGPEEGARPN